MPDQLHAFRRDRGHPIFQQRGLLQQDRRDCTFELQPPAVVGKRMQPPGQIGRDVDGIEEGEQVYQHGQTLKPKKT